MNLRPEQVLATVRSNPEFRRKIEALAKRIAFEHYWDANRMLEDFARDWESTEEVIGYVATAEVRDLHRKRLRLWGDRLIEFGVMTEADYQHHNPEKKR